MSIDSQLAELPVPLAVDVERGVLTARALDEGGKIIELNRNQVDAVLAWYSAQAGVDIFRYEGYSTGRFGQKKNSGVSFQYRQIFDSSTSYFIFNALLDRQRNTKSGKRGAPLPTGHFSVGRGSKFFRFWMRVVGHQPRSLTAFHDCMGKLKPIFITGNYKDDNGRLDKDSLLPLECSFVVGNLSDSQTQRTGSARFEGSLFGKIPPRCEVVEHSLSTSKSDKESLNNESQACLARVSASFQQRITNRDQAGTNKRVFLECIEAEQAALQQIAAGQTNDQWMASYDLEEVASEIRNHGISSNGLSYYCAKNLLPR